MAARSERGRQVSSATLTLTLTMAPAFWLKVSSVALTVS
jgi:hypothetical protein